jgi:hypothetical protein
VLTESDKRSESVTLTVSSVVEEGSVGCGTSEGRMRGGAQREKTRTGEAEQVRARALSVFMLSSAGGD